MEAHEQRFRRFLAERGLRYTRGRRAIVKEVFADDKHFEAKELLASLHRRDDRVSRATLYRTLALLVESGLLDELTLGEKHAHYEHVLGHEHHDHLVCNQCGRIIEFASPAIERLQQQVCRQYQFTASGHRMRIFGRCEECAKSGA